MQDATRIGAQRHEMTLAKYHDGRTPEDGDPDEVDTITVWTEPDGTQITDEARIAALDASLQEGQ
jgi:hypothetical protein